MFYSDDKRLMYIDCIEDLISLKDIDIKIYNQNSRTEENYYKWENGFFVHIIKMVWSLLM